MGNVAGHFAADVGIDDQAVGLPNVMSIVGTLLLQDSGGVLIVNDDAGLIHGEFGALDEVGKIGLPKGAKLEFPDRWPT